MNDPVDTDALRQMGAVLTNDGHPFGPRITAAADQLEAVQRWSRSIDGQIEMFAHERLDAILAAHTAPQENRGLADRARREGWHDIDGNETHR